MATRSGRSRERAAPRLAEYRTKRDFERTAEPRGADDVAAGEGLAFVIQKHAASRLHYDLRLELDGVMKSWAVPKGPSLDPADKRLAVEVEDHPIEYNTFEGTIPKGEYGGGTVMLWDRGTYTVDDADGDDAAAARRGLEAGKLSISFQGERLRGSFALVRTRGEGDKPQWLFFKHDDEHADPEFDAADAWTTSVDSGRTMDEIAGGKGGGRVWRSNRGEAGSGPAPASKRGGPDRLSSFAPMLAATSADLPSGERWSFEPKWDGIRIVAFAAPDGVALITRNGNEKRTQFPEVAGALQQLARELGESFVVDGELVGLQEGGIVRFESLQGRMHVAEPGAAQRLAQEMPAALVVFDLLLRGDEVLLAEPWTRRREALEALLSPHQSDTVRLGDTSPDLEAMIEQARAGGWEGLIAKRVDAPYSPGKRSRSWLKVKLENRQEFVVGGWTEPRGSRPHLGALLLGYYDPEGRFVYAGHTGTGFSHDALREMHDRLRRLERKTSPFTTTPKTNETPHWTTPRVIVDVRFNEWTRTGVLRQPVFLGVRDDKEPREVVREPVGPLQAQGTDDAAADAATGGASRPRKRGERGAKPTSEGRSAEPKESAENGNGKGKRGAPVSGADTGDTVVDRLTELQRGPGEGTLRISARRSLQVTSLRKVFFPREKLTKGDLMRYYATMAAHLLPHIKDRPLVLKRFPNGIRGESFYQQNPGDSVPDGVRVEVVGGESDELQRRFVGGDLLTLLYTIQLGAISHDPWHSRVGRLEFADYTILDLDPGPGATFAKVVEVAHRVREELDRLELHGALKTSGATGLHIYLPVPPRTPLDAARLIAEIIATRVAERHPRIATVERMTRRRPRGTVYVDYLQNIVGKTVAGVYAVRARPGATVSTPLRWDELTDDLDPRDFTLRNVPERVERLGDLWAQAMSRKNSLARLLPRASK